MSEKWQGKLALFCLSGKLGQVSFAWVQVSLVTQESGCCPNFSPDQPPPISTLNQACGFQAWPKRQKGSWGGNAGQAMSVGWYITFKYSDTWFGALICSPANEVSGWVCSSFCILSPLLPSDPRCLFLHASKLTPNWGLPTANLLPGKLFPALFPWLLYPLPSFLYKRANLSPLHFLLLILLYFVHST